MRIDSYCVRLCSFLVSCLVVLAIVFNYSFLFVILAVDFFIRGFISQRYSPLSMLSAFALRVIGVTPKFIAADQRYFASKLGFLMSIACFAFSIFKLTTLLMIFAANLILFPLLDALANFCLGAFIYRRLGSIHARPQLK